MFPVSPSTAVPDVSHMPSPCVSNGRSRDGIRIYIYISFLFTWHTFGSYQRPRCRSRPVALGLHRALHDLATVRFHGENHVDRSVVVNRHHAVLLTRFSRFLEGADFGRSFISVPVSANFQINSNIWTRRFLIGGEIFRYLHLKILRNWNKFGRGFCSPRLPSCGVGTMYSFSASSCLLFLSDSRPDHYQFFRKTISPVLCTGVHFGGVRPSPSLGWPCECGILIVKYTY